MDYASAKECRERRGEACRQLQDLVVRCKAEENRSFTNEERELFDRLDKEQETLRQTAEDMERVERFEGMSLTETRAALKTQAAVSNSPVMTRAERNRALRGWFLAGTQDDSEENRR